MIVFEFWWRIALSECGNVKSESKVRKLGMKSVCFMKEIDICEKFNLRK